MNPRTILRHLSLGAHIQYNNHCYYLVRPPPARRVEIRADVLNQLNDYLIDASPGILKLAPGVTVEKLGKRGPLPGSQPRTATRQQVSLSLPVELVARLKTEAERQGITFSAAVIAAIEKGKKEAATV